MQQGYFITGTDTNVGKTWATVALMRYFINQQHSVIGMKPVSAGCVLDNGQLKNDDALLLQRHASITLDYDLINPYAYLEPISPHLAGVANPVVIAQIIEGFNALKPLADIVLVEGAGGWYTPLNANQSIADLAQALALPVIMVVAMRLGCLNHALLTYRAIESSGVPCAGWLAMCTDPDMLQRDANIQTLTAALPVPLLAVLPYQDTPDFNGLAACLAEQLNAKTL